jgi:adenylate cyclase class 1
MAQIIECFYARKSANTRYIFQLAKSFYCLQFKNMRPHYNSFTSEEALIESLAATHTEFRPLAVDKRALKQTPLPVIATKIRANSVNIFYRRFDIGMEIYISDEKGSLTYEKYRGLNNYNPLIPLHGFVRACTNRQARIQPEILSEFGVLPVYFYELSTPAGDAMQCVQKQVPQRITNSSVFEVKAVAYADQDRRIRYNFICEEQEYTHAAFAEQLFLVFAQYVISRRKTNDIYPIYITDLDLSLCANEITRGSSVQLSHYIKIKNFLEFKLNQAIGVLMRA